MKTKRGFVVAAMATWAAMSVACGGAEWSSTSGHADELTVATRLPALRKPAQLSIRNAARGTGSGSTVTLPGVQVTDGTNVAPPASSPAPQCQTLGEAGALVQVAAAAEVAMSAKSASRYAVSQTPRLFVAALLRNVCGGHTATFDLYTPQGDFYARLSRPFNTVTGNGGRAASDGFVVEAELPIAGTLIESQGLFGAWSLNVSLDAGGLAIGLGEFELVQ